MKDNSGKDIGSKLEHLLSIKNNIGIIPVELNYPEVTDDFAYLLAHFWALKRRKGIALSYLEIQAYNEMTKANLSGFEVEMIMTIEQIFEAQNYE